MLRALRNWLLEGLGFTYEGGFVQPEGWRTPVMSYRFKCPRHGYVQNTPKGYSQRLECPICLRELRRKNPSLNE